MLFWAIWLLAASLPFDGYHLFGVGSAFKVLGISVLWILCIGIVASPRLLARVVTAIRSPISRGALFFVSWSTLTVLWAPNLDWSLSRVGTYAGLLGVMYSLAVLDVSLVARVWGAALLGAGLSVPLGFVLEHPNPLFREVGRFSGGGKDPNDYANLLVVILAVTHFGARRYFGSFGRALLWGAAVLTFPAVVFSGSRTAMVCALALLGLAIIAGSDRRQALRLLAAGVFLVGALSVIDVGYARTTLARGASLVNWKSVATWAGRWDLWEAALRVFRENPVGGVGVGNFPWVAPQYSPYADAMVEARGYPRAAVAHNSFLSVLAETGAIGLLLFVTLQVCSLRLAIARLGKDALARGVALALAGYWIASLTLSWEYSKVAFLLYGSLLSLARARL